MKLQYYTCKIDNQDEIDVVMDIWQRETLKTFLRFQI